jgi:hypothetical protein
LEEERRLHGENIQEPEPLDDRVREILRIPDTNHQMINVNLRKRQAQSHEEGCSDEEVERDLRSAIEDSHLRLSSYGKLIVFLDTTASEFLKIWFLSLDKSDDFSISISASSVDLLLMIDQQFCELEDTAEI